MISNARILFRLVAAIACAYATYAVLRVLLDQLSDLFERGTVVRDISEMLLAILAPMTFGLLIMIVFAVTFYRLLPKWFPRVWGA